MIDANEAVARVAYAVSENIAIYPITPASPMGEFADAWAAQGELNIFGAVPQVIEMQSEAGAAGALHGALQGGTLATTFTASQGLLLMLPNMFKIAGELTPAVMHVAARTVATHALSIFGDHSDVMAARMTGWAMLCAATPQEAHDFALVSHAATLLSRIPFIHFFDGFRTSHEINKVSMMSEELIAQALDWGAIVDHRRRSLDPDSPVIRGTAQNPDVFFQAREANNNFYSQTPSIVQSRFEWLFEKTGRRYQLFDYVGHPAARRVIVLMGSGCEAAEEAVERMVAQGDEVGLVKVRLFRPFCIQSFLGCLPSSTECMAVLDRTKEPGAVGEPLYEEVVCALSESEGRNVRRIIGGRYGLSSKEFTPAMVKAVFRELEKEAPKRHFTIGIHDDVTGLSLPWEPDDWQEDECVTTAVFYGLGSDGTVSANKNSVKIVGEETELHAQGYFVYDSKKSGAITISHLRFSPKPIRSTYLVRQARFVACHQFEFLRKIRVLDIAAPGATFLLNSPYSAADVWDYLPRDVQQTIVDKGLNVYVVDAQSLARQAGMPGRINTIMQTCFFALIGVLPTDVAIGKIKSAIEKTYTKRGRSVIDKNFEAVDAALAGLQPVVVPDTVTSQLEMVPAVTANAPEFEQRVTAAILSGHGDLLPVSAFPIDGTFPSGTARYEKRNIAEQIPVWEADICIECGLCALVCPHAAIRTKRFDSSRLEQAPAGFVGRNKPGSDSHLGEALVIQVSPEDCTGCGVCVDICPAKDKEVARRKAINMLDKREHLEQQKTYFQFVDELPDVDRSQVKADTVKGSQLLLPLFEYSGACAGCGETPYLKLMSQLFGDRAVIANATGCSSIYGGNLPTTPWSVDRQGRGPAWANSLFEDNAEFGLGLRLALNTKRERAEYLLRQVAPRLDGQLVQSVFEVLEQTHFDYSARRSQLDEVSNALQQVQHEYATELRSLLVNLVPRSMWIVGGDGWAFDIGFGGLDHVIASRHNVNIIVLDTGVYSNTGGQASKATPRAASAKFASNGRSVQRKDLGMLAVSYGGVYVAQVALGANPAQCVRAFHEAESFDGPSLILAYSQCIAHGIDMTTGMSHQKDLVKSGFWPLYRYDPREAHDGGHPFHLDSRKPSIPFKEVAAKEARFAMLMRSNPERAKRLLDLAQRDINETWHYYEQLAGVEREYSDLATV
ncbi:MAG: pyruvate:ferredoxin (flavodoxin) oxidoreductase [Planctomycetales bacterium]|nr:pyruvate:ferredoxin (flavodoxin) oxidoreductase [Planctomycetales bacterium]